MINSQQDENYVIKRIIHVFGKRIKQEMLGELNVFQILCQSYVHNPSILFHVFEVHVHED